MEKIIAYDFMGVLDIKDSFKVNDPSLNFRIRKQTDVDKAVMLFRLAKETGAKLVSISSFAAYSPINRIVMAAIMQNNQNPDNQDMVDFLSNNRREAKNMFLNCSFDSKQGVINKMNERYPDSKLVVFEDEYTLTNCEFIRVNHGGLTEEHIERAKTFFES